MKIMVIDRMNVIIPLLIITSYQKGEHFAKDCQEINTKNIFMNFDALPLNRKFLQIPIFTDISHCIDQFHN